jgi:hypothetical protein
LAISRHAVVFVATMLIIVLLLAFIPALSLWLL